MGLRGLNRDGVVVAVMMGRLHECVVTTRKHRSYNREMATDGRSNLTNGIDVSSWSCQRTVRKSAVVAEKGSFRVKRENEECAEN